MADLGAITEIVNSSNTFLEVGLDRYVRLLDLNIHIGRPEDRTATTDPNVLYTYGKGDNWFTATIVFTGPEIDGTAFTNATTAASFNELSQLTSDGDMNSIDWKIVATDVSAATKTFAATGVLRDYDVRKPREDGAKVEIDIFVRITGDTISIT